MNSLDHPDLKTIRDVRRATVRWSLLVLLRIPVPTLWTILSRAVKRSAMRREVGRFFPRGLSDRSTHQFQL